MANGDRGHLPELTQEQRMEYLTRAAEARTERARALREIARGELSAEGSMGDPRVVRCKVYVWLRAFPGIGERKAQGIMQRLGISPSRRVQGMGARQRERVLQAIAEARSDGGR